MEQSAGNCKDCSAIRFNPDQNKLNLFCISQHRKMFTEMIGEIQKGEKGLYWVKHHRIQRFVVDSVNIVVCKTDAKTASSQWVIVRVVLNRIIWIAWNERIIWIFHYLFLQEKVVFLHYTGCPTTNDETGDVLICHD